MGSFPPLSAIGLLRLRRRLGLLRIRLLPASSSRFHSSRRCVPVLPRRLRSPPFHASHRLPRPLLSVPPNLAPPGRFAPRRLPARPLLCRPPTCPIRRVPDQPHHCRIQRLRHQIGQQSGQIRRHEEPSSLLSCPTGSANPGRLRFIRHHACRSCPIRRRFWPPRSNPREDQWCCGINGLAA